MCGCALLYPVVCSFVVLADVVAARVALLEDARFVKRLGAVVSAQGKTISIRLWPGDSTALVRRFREGVLGADRSLAPPAMRQGNTLLRWATMHATRITPRTRYTTQRVRSPLLTPQASLNKDISLSGQRVDLELRHGHRTVDAGFGLLNLSALCARAGDDYVSSDEEDFAADDRLYEDYAEDEDEYPEDMRRYSGGRRGGPSGRRRRRRMRYGEYEE